MRQRATGGDRSNALWGRGSRGEQRSNALWGRGGRRAGAVTAALTVTFVMAAAAAGQSHGKPGSSGDPGSTAPFVSASLLSGIQTNPQATFDVLIQGDGSNKSNAIA